jgi:hypothetical protein
LERLEQDKAPMYQFLEPPRSVIGPGQMRDGSEKSFAVDDASSCTGQRVLTTNAYLEQQSVLRIAVALER